MQIILYITPDSDSKIYTVLHNETIWLTTEKMAGMFDVQRPAITKNLRNIYDIGELVEQVVSSILEHSTAHVAIFGKTQTRAVKYYNLEKLEKSRGEKHKNDLYE